VMDWKSFVFAVVSILKLYVSLLTIYSVRVLGYTELNWLVQKLGMSLEVMVVLTTGFVIITTLLLLEIMNTPRRFVRALASTLLFSLVYSVVMDAVWDTTVLLLGNVCDPAVFFVAPLLPAAPAYIRWELRREKRL